MARPPSPTTLAGLALTATLLASCAIRLPLVAPGAHPPPALTATTTTPAPDPDVLVWLTADTFHTGLVLPYDWLLESGFVPPAGLGQPMFVAMSWGNRNAYSKEGINTPGKFLRVIFTATPSVMEIIPIDWHVAEVCPHQRIWRKLVPRERGPALAAFLNGCSTRGPDGKPLIISESSWGRGLQVQGSHAYYIPRICNVWTAQAIECLGGHINPWLALTANGLARQAVTPPNDFELIWPGRRDPELRSEE